MQEEQFTLRGSVIAFSLAALCCIVADCGTVSVDFYNAPKCKCSLPAGSKVKKYIYIWVQTFSCSNDYFGKHHMFTVPCFPFPCIYMSAINHIDMFSIASRLARRNEFCCVECVGKVIVCIKLYRRQWEEFSKNLPTINLMKHTQYIYEVLLLSWIGWELWQQKLCIEPKLHLQII